MKYLIKIDRKSIKKNPNAGNNTYIEQTGYPDCSFTIEGDHQEIRFPNVVLTQFSRFIGSSYINKATYCYMGKTNEIEELITYLAKKYKEKFTYSINYRHEVISTMTPEAPYFYKYKDKNIKCCHCKQKFSYKSLKDEDDYDYDENYYGRSNVCPKCNEEDCCELEFENIGTAVASMKDLPSIVVGRG